jgi:hypothetical protein
MVWTKLDIYMWKAEITPSSVTLYRNQFKWIKNLNVRPQNLKTYKTLGNIATGKEFFNRISVAWEIRARIDQWDYIRLKSFCNSTETTE